MSGLGLQTDSEVAAGGHRPSWPLHLPSGASGRARSHAGCPKLAQLPRGQESTGFTEQGLPGRINRGYAGGGSSFKPRVTLLLGQPLPRRSPPGCGKSS